MIAIASFACREGYAPPFSSEWCYSIPQFGIRGFAKEKYKVFK